MRREGRRLNNYFHSTSPYWARRLGEAATTCARCSTPLIQQQAAVASTTLQVLPISNVSLTAVEKSFDSGKNFGEKRTTPLM